jgi:hypothetical protein
MNPDECCSVTFARTNSNISKRNAGGNSGHMFHGSQPARGYLRAELRQECIHTRVVQGCQGLSVTAIDGVTDGGGRNTLQQRRQTLPQQPRTQTGGCFVQGSGFGCALESALRQHLQNPKGWHVHDADRAGDCRAGSGFTPFAGSRRIFTFTWNVTGYSSSQCARNSAFTERCQRGEAGDTTGRCF